MNSIDSYQSCELCGSPLERGKEIEDLQGLCQACKENPNDPYDKLWVTLVNGVHREEVKLKKKHVKKYPETMEEAVEGSSKFPGQKTEPKKEIERLRQIMNDILNRAGRDFIIIGFCSDCVYGIKSDLIYKCGVEGKFQCYPGETS